MKLLIVLASLVIPTVAASSSFLDAFDAAKSASMACDAAETKEERKVALDEMSDQHLLMGVKMSLTRPQISEMNQTTEMIYRCIQIDYPDIKRVNRN